MNLQMYRFFRDCARCSFLVIATTYTLLGCSSGPMPVTVPLESTRLAHEDCRRLQESSAPSVVYSCQTDLGPIFVATLKDCSIPEKFSFQATTRQLMVGLVGAKVAHQGPVSMGTFNTLQSVVTGTIDAEPVIMSTFTYRNKDCVTDIVLWQGVSADDLAKADRVNAFSESSKKLASALLNDNLLVQDVTPTEG
jgi:hypothetical protein